MYQTVIFDLDGTLLNTIDDLAAAGNFVCRQRGWPVHTAEQFQAMVGHGLRDLASNFSPEAFRSPETVTDTLERFRAYYAAHHLDKTAPYPGISALLERLRARGVRLAVCSNKADDFSRHLIGHFFPDLFALVRGQRAGTPTKPDPAVIREMLRELGASPETALMVGDSATDIRTGHNAGLPACGVTWGYRPRASLIQAGAEFLADTAEALEQVILHQ